MELSRQSLILEAVTNDPAACAVHQTRPEQSTVTTESSVVKPALLRNQR
jgi:hypothetical protein